jgi:hypothetical protein
MKPPAPPPPPPRLSPLPLLLPFEVVPAAGVVGVVAAVVDEVEVVVGGVGVVLGKCSSGWQS